VYCLCVSVYCHRATTQLHLINISSSSYVNHNIILLGYNDIGLWRHTTFGPFHDVLTGFDSISPVIPSKYSVPFHDSRNSDCVLLELIPLLFLMVKADSCDDYFRYGVIPRTERYCDRFFCGNFGPPPPPFIITLTFFYAYFNFDITFVRRTSGWNLGTFKRMPFRISKRNIGVQKNTSIFFLFQTVWTGFFNLYYDQQMHNYFTNYHTPTCFDTIVSSSGSL